MTSLLDIPRTAPAVGEVVREVHAALDRFECAAPADPRELTHAVHEVERARRRLDAARLRLIAEADRADVAAETGMSSTGSWLSRRTHAGTAEASRDVRLATALAEPMPVVDEATALLAPDGDLLGGSAQSGEAGDHGGALGAGFDAVTGNGMGPGTGQRPTAQALSSGLISRDHADVIMTALDRLPRHLDAAERLAVERHLLDRARTLTPAQLRRDARRALEATETDRQAVDAHQDQQLRDDEAAACAKTRLTWHRNDDGTLTGHFTVPEVAGAILTKVIQAMTAPRRAALGAGRDQSRSDQTGAPAERLDWARANGDAFRELLEHLPTDHLHPQTAATVIVTIDHERLTAAVGAARLDTGADISAGDLRRLACGAGILPAVLDGRSRTLDLGHSSRLFTAAQRLALATFHETCAADGCERPFAWCELHHRQPWSHGGSTNLADAVPLCSFHHHRIHDRAYEHRSTPSGITFHRRT